MPAPAGRTASKRRTERAGSRESGEGSAIPSLPLTRRTPRGMLCTGSTRSIHVASGTDFFPQSGELAALIRAKDWAQTPLGPLETWSPSLRTILRLMLTSRYAMWMGWGPELSFFYNDAYARQTLGSKHPWALGRPSQEVWAEIWDTLNPRIQHVLSTGQATWDEGPEPSPHMKALWSELAA